MHFIRITLILSLFLFSTACVQAVRPPHSVNSDEGLLALVFSNIVTSGTTPVAPSSPCNPCKIYVTTQIYNGNLGGVTGADDKCMTNSNKPPDGKTYKAMILDVTNRRACFYGDCLTDPSPDVDKINWVLYPNTDYVRPDGTPIFTSNANAIIILQPGSPGATTLSNPISSITPIAPNVWTGMTAGWTNSASVCDFGAGPWTDFSTSGSGAWGDSGNITQGAIFINTKSCDQNSALYCVEQ